MNSGTALQGTGLGVSNLSFQSISSLAQRVGRSAHYLHYLVYSVGFVALGCAASLLLHTSWRAEFAQRLLTYINVQANLPAVSPTSSPSVATSGDTTAGNWLALADAPSVAHLARRIPLQRVALEGRDGAALDSLQEQTAVAEFIARKYHVAKQATQQLVKAAYATGQEVGIDPVLLLAVMAVESGFNPFAESHVGAQGLMQVMTKIHRDKYAAVGGVHAALNPSANIKIGALVLKDCIARAGSVEGGLKYYVGAALHATDGGYGAKVLGERLRFKQVAAGYKDPQPLLAVQKPVAKPSAVLDTPIAPSLHVPSDDVTPPSVADQVNVG